MLRSALSTSLRSAIAPRSVAALRLAAATPVATRTFSSTALRADKNDGLVDESIRRGHPDIAGPNSGKGGPEFEMKYQGSRKERVLKSFSMAGKTAVITGGARGLGNVMARALVESGCNQVAILDLKQDDAQAAADEMTAWIEKEANLPQGEVDIRGFSCDVSTEESVKEAFVGVKQAFGKVDTVINSAGIVENFPAIDYPTNNLKKLYGINIYGSHFVAAEAARMMVADNIKGSIILIASMSGSIVNIPQPQAPYNASKAAVKHLASCLAVEWAQYGIRVNSISPGYMATSLTQQMFERNEEGKQLKATWEKLIPVGRMGAPEDLKGAAVYLASDASTYTTGADLIVDGGYVTT